MIARDDPEYPPPLQNIPDPPSLLYVKGPSRAHGPARDRASSARGAARLMASRIAERLAGALARTGFTVVSGLARGIDAAAHRGAIKAGGRSIAVLANGLASVYPPEHEDLARALVECGRPAQRDADAARARWPDCSPSGTGSFPGSALGVVVVEATPRSGSLSTARHAIEQNREVFAVPGPADSLSSRGCHRLIRDGARLVETVDDILEELGPLADEIRTDPGEPPVRHPAELASDRLGAVAPGPSRRPADGR